LIFHIKSLMTIGKKKLLLGFKMYNQIEESMDLKSPEHCRERDWTSVIKLYPHNR